jgi:hypothetical protein
VPEAGDKSKKVMSRIVTGTVFAAAIPSQW